MRTKTNAANETMEEDGILEEVEFRARVIEYIQEEIEKVLDDLEKGHSLSSYWLNTLLGKVAAYRQIRDWIGEANDEE